MVEEELELGVVRSAGIGVDHTDGNAESDEYADGRRKQGDGGGRDGSGGKVAVPGGTRCGAQVARCDSRGLQKVLLNPDICHNGRSSCQRTFGTAPWSILKMC